MNIRYFEKERIFKIDTEHVSYVMAVIDEEQFLEHVYFGRRLHDSDLRYLLRHQENPFLPSTNGGERGKVLACMKHELPGELVGDHRDGAVTVRSAGGHTALQPYYVSHRIYRGKDRLEGLPATFGHPEETMTLEITMEDPVLGVRFLLSWSIFSDNDAVMRSLRVLNCSDAPVRLEKALSLSLDMDCTDPDQKPFRLLTLDGMWVRERHMNYRDIGYGFQGVSSNRGETSHHEQPFLGLVSPSATQHQGEVYGFHLVYSGNFRGQVERDSYDTIRVTLGINPDRFSFTLQPGESFQAPEGVMVYSCQGLGGMTHTFHDLYRNHLIRGIWRDKKRPILINNWEATYFDFDSDKLLEQYKKQYGKDLTFTYHDHLQNTPGLMELPENNAGVELFWRFSQMTITPLADGDAVVEAVHDSVNGPTLGLCSASKLDNSKQSMGESGMDIAWVTGLTPYTAQDAAAYSYVVSGCDNPAGARLFIKFMMGGDDGQSGCYNVFDKLGHWSVRDDVTYKKSGITYEEVNLTAPDFEHIYQNYPNVKAYWTLWNSTR